MLWYTKHSFLVFSLAHSENRDLGELTICEDVQSRAMGEGGDGNANRGEWSTELSRVPSAEIISSSSEVSESVLLCPSGSSEVVFSSPSQSVSSASMNGSEEVSRLKSSSCPGSARLSGPLPEADCVSAIVRSAQGKKLTDCSGWRKVGKLGGDRDRSQTRGERRKNDPRCESAGRR